MYTKKHLVCVSHYAQAWPLCGSTDISRALSVEAVDLFYPAPVLTPPNKFMAGRVWSICDTV